jgi:UDP-2,3-diacylglucosamine hydrolase
MAVALIADCHLGGPGGPPERLVEQLRELPERGCKRLVLLGDVFHYWVGNRSFETPEVGAVLPELARLRDCGIRLDYVEGNRDFFIADSPYAGAFDSIGTEVAFTAGGRRYLAVHGDGLNDHDRQYLFWRWLSKSPPVRYGIRWLPGPVARRLMQSTEGRLAETNFKHRNAIPVEAISAYAERRLQEGHDVLVLGHFHRPKTWSVEGGEVRLFDAWFNSHRVEWLG